MTNQPPPPGGPYSPPPTPGEPPMGQTPQGAPTPGAPYPQQPLGESQQPYGGQQPPQQPIGGPPPGGIPPYGSGGGYGPGGAPQAPMVSWPGIVALVCGILALLGAWIPMNVFSIALAIAGIVLGIVGLSMASKGRAKKGLSIAGIITSVVAIITTIVSLVVFGAFVDDIKKNPEKYVSAIPSSLRTDMPDEKTVSGSVGDTLKVDLGLVTPAPGEITLVEVKDNAAATGALATPSPGKRFVAAHFKIKNTSTETARLLNDAKAFNADGQGAMHTFRKPADGQQLDFSVELKPGGEADGWMLFEMNTADKLSSITLGKAEWKAK